MPEKILPQLGNVQSTMLLPLWGRAEELKRANPLLIDRKAGEIVEKIAYDFQALTKNIHPITQFEWVARCIHIDAALRKFLAVHPRATVVNVGCGLDTTFDRVDNGSVLWYDLDMPDSITLRRQFIQEQERRIFLSGSFLDEQWLEEIKIEDGLFIMAAGVFYYFEPADMKNIFGKIANKYPGAEILFDAASAFGVKVANKKVIESTGLDARSHLKWALEHASEIHAWNEKIEVAAEYPMFKQLLKGQPFRKQMGARFSDWLRIMYMVHLRIVP